MADSSSALDLQVSFRGTTHTLSLPSEARVSELQDRLEELTSVSTDAQKLLARGKRLANPSATLQSAGLTNGARLTLLGSTNAEIGSVQKVESDLQKRDRILRERAARPSAKVRSTGPSGLSFLASSSRYIFMKIEPLSHLPNPENARSLLQRLASDEAIAHVMQTHEFSVGLLTELAPHEHPELLGLNVNAGQQIKLRIRTDRYDGFRNYNEIRRVLCHELTHNVHSDHDDKFKTLNSQLNREVAQFESDKRMNNHTFHDGDVYEPGVGFADTYIDDMEDRRRMMLQAAERRLQKQEEEIEYSCGTTGPNATKTN